MFNILSYTCVLFLDISQKLDTTWLKLKQDWIKKKKKLPFSFNFTITGTFYINKIYSFIFFRGHAGFKNALEIKNGSIGGMHFYKYLPFILKVNFIIDIRVVIKLF